MKCSACKNKACNWKYANRNYCLGKKEGIDCTCTCQVSDLKTVVASVVSFACGAALIGTGVALAMNPIGIATALCLNPIGIATLPLSGACIGGGSSMIITPFINKMNGEKMTFGNSGRNFLIGAGLGAVGGALITGNGLVAAGELARAQCVTTSTIASVGLVFTAYNLA